MTPSSGHLKNGWAVRRFLKQMHNHATVHKNISNNYFLTFYLEFHLMSCGSNILCSRIHTILRVLSPIQMLTLTC